MGALVIFAISGVVYAWLRPHLGKMNWPVLVYILVIAIMVSGAWSVLGSRDFLVSGRTMVFVVAVSFYLSDLFVARDRFLEKAFVNRLVGLPMYYAGQFFLAFSVGLLK